jgi:1,2-diacylglycerol 3-alpha-glucosyltransferase
LAVVSNRYHQWIFRASELVAVPTDEMAESLVGQGVERSKVRTLPPIFDYGQVTVLKQAEVARVRSSHGLTGQVVVYIGRVSPEKSLDKLLQAWAQVVAQQVSASLLIIGGGTYEVELKNLVKLYGLEPSVRMLGPVEHEELLASGLISACDVFVSMSTTETFGLAALEAMAHGVPVVLARAPGLAGMVGDGGLIVEPHDLPGIASHLGMSGQHSAG